MISPNERSNGRRRRVVIVQTLLKQYRGAFYEELRARLEAAGVELELLHSCPWISTDRGDALELEWARPVYGRQLSFGARGVTLQWYMHRLRRADLVVVEQAVRLLANYPLLVAQQLGLVRVAMWGHGGDFGGREDGLSAAARRRMTLMAHWFFAYTDESADLVSAWGVPRSRITVVRNAIDTRGLRARMAGAGEGAERLRARLGLDGDNVGVFVGSLHESKRLDFLFTAADDIRAEICDFELVVAGGGPLSEAVRRLTDDRPWAHYLGPTFGDDLAAVYRLGKLLLVPGWVGLVMVDSLATGVPLVTSASSAHPPEIGYLEHGVNGWMVQDGGDPARYAADVVDLLRDDPRRRRLIEGCLASADEYTAENMAERFANGLLQALE